MNSVSTIIRAVNYFTLHALSGYSDRKAALCVKQISSHLDLNTPFDSVITDLARLLAKSRADVESAYAEVIKGFDLLSPDDYVVEVDQGLYPQRLAITEQAPAFLFMRGNPLLAQLHTVAVVGTRRPSEEGQEKAKTLAMLLGKYRIVVVSGLAMGIDRAAHEGALASPTPTTVAVLGTPLNKVYPREHTDLQRRISEEGLLVSQFAPSAPVHRWNFPARNAVMSGICLATVVVEAGESSGALIQADYALKQGRLVFVPQSAVERSDLRWPRKYVNQRGAEPFSRVSDLIDRLQRSQVVEEGDLLDEAAIHSSNQVVVHHVHRD